MNEIQCVAEAELKRVLDYVTDEGTGWNVGTGMALLAMKCMYEAGGDSCYREKLLACLDQLLLDSGDLQKNEFGFDSSAALAGRVLEFAYRLTGVEKYKEAFLELIQSSRLECSFVPEEFFSKVPFYMVYETEYNRKEGYNRLYGQFQEAEKKILPDRSEEEQGWFLMALVEAGGIISEQIFEQMKYLHTLFKSRMKCALEWNLLEAGELTVLMLSYSIMKACRLEAVLEEKYFAIGEEMFQNVLESLGKSESGLLAGKNQSVGCQSAIVASLVLMAKSEQIRRKKG